MTSSCDNESISNVSGNTKYTSNNKTIINNLTKVNLSVSSIDVTQDVTQESCHENLDTFYFVGNENAHCEASVNGPLNTSGHALQEEFIPTPTTDMINLLSTNNAMETPSKLIESPISTSISLETSNSILNKLRITNINRILCAHLNINSIRNKIDMLADLVVGKVDVLLVSETKIDVTFPTSQFQIPGYTTPYRLDRTIAGGAGGGILLYIREDIPSKLLYSQQTHNNIECLFVEINLYKKKWLIGGTYNPSKDMISNHINQLGAYIEEYLPSYDNILIMGDFNSEPLEAEMKAFCELYCLNNLVKEPTCFKNPDNPSCIDLILTNRKMLFQNTNVVETGLSDFHKMTVTVLKTYFKKAPPKIVSYRDYKKFSHVEFRMELQHCLSQYDVLEISNDEFVRIFMGVFEKHAPLKQKYVRANQGPFMTKELRKAVMTQSRLRNKFNQFKTKSSELEYKKQRNLCTYLFRKAKRDYYSALNPTCVTDNKKFWRTVKPLFSEKFLSAESITLVEGNEIFQDDDKVSETFNDFFSNAVSNLNIQMNNDYLNKNVSETDPVLNAIKRYENHPSIVKIKEVFKDGDTFCFKPILLYDVQTEIMLLDNSKACPKDTIPTNIIKDNCDIIACKLQSDFNKSINSASFPDNLKNADITPVHKKGDRTDKSNYRPVSILPPLSKINERLLYYQIDHYMDTKLSENLFGFRKGRSSQQCLTVMLEKWRTTLDKKGFSGMLLTDLSKAFDSLSHKLLIAKLDAYGFDYNSIKLMHNYLVNRQQRVRINSKYSSWSEILNGVPQGSILGPLLFNIYLSDLFLFTKDSNIANYADDNSPYACKKDNESVISTLEEDSGILLNWVANNALKANPDKFHLLLSQPDDNISVNIDGFQINNSKSEKLLGITIDNKLRFNEHVSGLCKKASQKLHALARVANYMNTNKRSMIMKAFITSQFGYCPLVWMFHSRSLNNRINKIHERALRIVFNDKKSSFDELLKKDGSVTIHERNIQTLAIEMYKVYNRMSPQILSEVFPLKESSIYCSKFPFKTRNVRSVTYGTETLGYLGPKIWSLLPEELKTVGSLKEFKTKIKIWRPDGCPCRLCKRYVDGVGFMETID